MIEFLAANLSTILVALVVFGLVIWDVWVMIRNAKQGKHSCCGNCSGCSGGCSSCGSCQSSSGQ